MNSSSDVFRRIDDPFPPPLRFDEDGLVPAVIQDATTHEVLMTAFMNATALAATRATGRTHFWSRSRGKLWRKGGTSGHEQIVQRIYVNCELNSLLITVDQVGAACHDGYPTCYYRAMESDNTLTIVRDRVFDPAAVYGARATAPLRHDSARAEATPAVASSVPGSDLARETALQYGAYRWLRENDLTEVSRTSAALRDDEDRVSTRIAEELRELAGVLDGTHRHSDQHADVALEAGQVIYWILLAASRAGTTWEALRPDAALLTGHSELSAVTTARLLRSEAGTWAAPSAPAPRAARCHAALALVGQTCLVADISPLALVEADLTALRSKPYLGLYFNRS